MKVKSKQSRLKCKETGKMKNKMFNYIYFYNCNCYKSICM